MVSKQRKFVLKKLPLVGQPKDFFGTPRSTSFEFPTQADFDKIEDKQQVKITEIVAASAIHGYLDGSRTSLSDGSKSSLLGASGGGEGKIHTMKLEDF